MKRAREKQKKRKRIIHNSHDMNASLNAIKI